MPDACHGISTAGVEHSPACAQVHEVPSQQRTAVTRAGLSSVELCPEVVTREESQAEDPIVPFRRKDLQYSFPPQPDDLNRSQ
jgi:hypothetical protein